MVRIHMTIGRRYGCGSLAECMGETMASACPLRCAPRLTYGRYASVGVVYDESTGTRGGLSSSK